MINIKKSTSKIALIKIISKMQFKFTSSQVFKKQNEYVKLKLITLLISPTYHKILSLQNTINVRFIKKIFYFLVIISGLQNPM